MELSNKSQQLMLFFSKNDHVNYVEQTTKTKNILKELYHNIYEAHNYVKTRMVFRANVRKILTALHISKPKIFNAYNFPEQVRTHIDDMMAAEITYSFSLYDRNIKVYFIVENGDVETNIGVYNKYVETIAMWMYVLNIYSSKKCVKSLSIYLYFTSLEKQLPSSNVEVLDENNVNTAFTTTCPSVSEIVIFRQEEWFKVLIHESFHNFGLDFSGMNCESIHNCILNIFDVSSEVNAYEAYTEFWAALMNALFCSFFELKVKEDWQEFLLSSEFYINFERTYSFFQMVKTLQFMGLNYYDLYAKTEHARVLRENLYKEKTNVLSYFVLKTIMLNNYQGFLGWCKKHNFSVLDFKKTIGNQREFCDFIKKNYKTQSMLDGVNDALHFLSKINKKRTNKYILSNMRMTICELG